MGQRYFYDRKIYHWFFIDKPNLVNIYIIWTSKPPSRGSRKKTPHTHILYAHKKCLFAPHAVKTIKEYDTHIHVHIYKSSRTYISALSQLSLFLVSAYFLGKIVKIVRTRYLKGNAKENVWTKDFYSVSRKFFNEIKTSIFKTFADSMSTKQSTFWQKTRLLDIRNCPPDFLAILVTSDTSTVSRSSTWVLSLTLEPLKMVGILMPFYHCNSN